MKELTAFYGIVAGVNFTLLGLWWVTVQERPHLRGPETGNGRTAYIISLQFVVPGTAALVSQVAPQTPTLWRVAFVIAGLAGGAGILMLAPNMGTPGHRVASRLLLYVGAPLYGLVAFAAAYPQLGAGSTASLNGPQWEGVLFCLLVLLGAQTAWTTAMSPAESRMQSPALTPTEPTAETTAESSAETTTETPAETTAESPADATIEPPAQAAAKS
ncbi:hypothetical protein [Paractinoplanes hotanensis]|uniref:Uncharacterized protein n=1 Tax=Paractinoplanes hotanensis TaxID=2906497 RepID=A0ABT0YE44_9ACTN|nr:hypothetical protein [Actinoplanes hotanensis]MCM4084327.1 hypothetical protein [Actinoplanes hotanensis]